jgi:hypothetical protein
MGATDAAVFFQTLIAVETIPIEPEVASLTFREIMSQPKQNLLQAVSFSRRSRATRH